MPILLTDIAPLFPFSNNDIAYSIMRFFTIITPGQINDFLKTWSLPMTLDAQTFFLVNAIVWTIILCAFRVVYLIFKKFKGVF